MCLIECFETGKRDYGQDGDHSSIAASLYQLGCAYEERDMLGEAEERHKKSFEMNKRIYGQNTAHPIIANGLYR